LNVEYVKRWYRQLMQVPELVSFEVKIEESDLFVMANIDVREKVRGLLERERSNLKAYLRYHPEFLSSLEPLRVPAFAPPICRLMAWAAEKARVGPMAAVAGAINERVFEGVKEEVKEFIVENGGDLLIVSSCSRVVAIYAGEDSPFSFKLGIKLTPGKWGVATSSGKVGPSLSFGKADAVVVVSDSAALADAWATSLANLVRAKEDVEKVLRISESAYGVQGVFVAFGEIMGVRGKIELVAL